MDEQVTIEQLPKSIQDKLSEVIELNPAIKSLRLKLEKCWQKKDYIGMTRYQHQLQQLKHCIEDEYMRQNLAYRKKIIDFKSTMSDDDQEVLAINSNMIILLADMLESSVMEIQEVFGRSNPAWKMEMFDKLQALGRECADQIKWMSQETDMYYQTTFADVADSITVMVRNKVKSLLRKTYAHNKRKG